MMRPSNKLPEVYLCREAVDFRKGINGLAVLVEDSLSLDPFSEILFVFCNRRRNRVKILYWEHSGFCLWQKRLEKSRFHWPRKRQGGIVTLTGQQLNWLLDGYDISRMKPHEKLHFSSVL
jgi:transposase